MNPISAFNIVKSHINLPKQKENPRLEQALTILKNLAFKENAKIMREREDFFRNK